MQLETAQPLSGDQVSRPAERTYALGHADPELERLTRQASVLAPSTRRFLADAGICPGMRVLDVGCGAGDVSLLVGDLVGPSGTVLGIDRVTTALETAKRRAATAAQDWVRFTAADVDAFATSERFDAVVGRLVLMYVPDPAATLRRLSGLLRPDGIVAFQEYDLASARSYPGGPVFSQCLSWLQAVFAATGADPRMGLGLRRAFLKAGLPAPNLRLDGLIGGGPDFVGYGMLKGVIASLLPIMEKLGIATTAEVDIATLEDRLRDEILRSDGVGVIPELIGASTRVPVRG